MILNGGICHGARPRRIAAQAPGAHALGARPCSDDDGRAGGGATIGCRLAHFDWMIQGAWVMCQQWFSVVGLILDVCGFLLIAREWWHVFQHSILLRQSAVHEDYVLTVEGEEAARRIREANASMWRNTQRENRKDNESRQKMFATGMVLVVLGFLGQLIGSLPYPQSFFHFTSCS
jgi:hypothetical protein